MTSTATLVREHYQSLGNPLRPGVTVSELDEFERVNNLVLPQPARDLYRQFDGLDYAVPDFFHDLHVWPLSELSRVSHRVAEYRGVPNYGPIVLTLPNAHEFLAFGDGTFWSHVVAFRLNDQAGPVLWISGASYAEVAPSFDEFWRRYLVDPTAVLVPTNEQIIAPAV